MANTRRSVRRPPRTRTRPRARAHVRCAPARTAAKLRARLSARLARAPATLTNEIPTRASTVRPREPKVTYPPPPAGTDTVRVPARRSCPLHVPWAAKGWLKRALKYTRYFEGCAQKRPLSTMPDTSRRPGSMATRTAVFPLELPPAFTSMLRRAPFEKVKRATPVRVVAVRSLAMAREVPGSSVTR